MSSQNERGASARGGNGSGGVGSGGGSNGSGGSGGGGSNGSGCGSNGSGGGGSNGSGGGGSNGSGRIEIGQVAAKKHVIIYTDGSCIKNPGGPGGWGAILLYKGHEKAISGNDPSTTNNKMEMTAAIRALECLKEPCAVTLHSDSAYLVNAFNKGWVRGWQRNGWRRSNGDPAKNPELWQRLIALGKEHDVTYVKVKGHSSNTYNNRCDKLATKEAEKARKSKAARAIAAQERNKRSGVAP